MRYLRSPLLQREHVLLAHLQENDDDTMSGFIAAVAPTQFRGGYVACAKIKYSVLVHSPSPTLKVPSLLLSIPIIGY